MRKGNLLREANGGRIGEQADAEALLTMTFEVVFGMQTQVEQEVPT